MPTPKDTGLGKGVPHDMPGPAANTDRELFREPAYDGSSDSYYANSIHVTAEGAIGMNVGGLVFVLPITEWHRLAKEDFDAQQKVMQKQKKNAPTHAFKEGGPADDPNLCRSCYGPREDHPDQKDVPTCVCEEFESQRADFWWCPFHGDMKTTETRKKGLGAALTRVYGEMEQHDPVNHPSHYTAYKGLEVIDLTEQMNFNRGNAVKYICRAGLKNKDREVEDLEKAIWYLTREVQRIKDETPAAGDDLRT